MKSIRIAGYGATPALDEVPIPDIGPDDVLVRVKAAGFNPLDVKLQSGAVHDFFPLTFPYAVGTDLSGTVEQVGSSVSRWHAGDYVVARVDPLSGGGFAELAAVPAALVAAAPKTTSLNDAAGIPTAACTAWQALFEVAHLQAGQTVLIHAGAGGVGSFAIQFAHAAGARVIATASSTGIGISRGLGADVVIDYASQSFENELSGVDVVLDTVAGATQQRSFGVLRPGGILVATPYPPDEEGAKAHNVTAGFVFHRSNGELLHTVIDKIDADRVTVLVDRTVPLTNFSEAFAYQASGRARGKILVSVS